MKHSEQKQVEQLLSVAAIAVQINKLAAETKPSAQAEASLARGIAWSMLTRAKALLVEPDND